MENDSLSFQDEGDRSGDVIMSDNDIDPNYEPSEDEVIKYAIYLGMNPEEDKEFFYIAREGLKAPVSKPWRACQTRSGEIYYWNFETGESQWDHPSDDIFRKKFLDLKALCNKGHNPREEQKVLKQLQKKQQVLQASKGLQDSKQNSNYLENEANQSIGSIEKENLQPNSFRKSSKHSFFDDNQLSLDKGDFGIDEPSYNQSQNPLHNHVEEPSFQQSEGLGIEPINSLRKVVSTIKKGIVQNEEEVLPETKNFYDDASINNESTIQLEGNNYLEGTKSSGLAGLVDVDNEGNIQFDDVKQDQEKIEEQEHEQEKEKEKEEDNENLNNEKESISDEINGQEWGSEVLKDDKFKFTGSLDKKSNEEKMFYEDSEANNENNISEENNVEVENLSKDEPFNLGQELQSGKKTGSMQSIEQDRENQLSFENHKHKESLLKKKNGTASICLSDIKAEGSDKKSGKVDTIVTIDELENDFSQILRQYEEELGAKFSKILGEYEQNYHKEAEHIYNEYQDQIADIRMELEQVLHQEKGIPLETELISMRRRLNEKYEKEISEEMQLSHRSLENRKREIEKEEGTLVVKIINEYKHHQETILDQEEEKLRYMIEENLDRIEKVKKETLKKGEMFMGKEAYEQKRNDLLREHEERIQDLEQEQNEILRNETDSFKEELEANFEEEKALVIQAYEHSQEEFKALKAQITQDFRESLEEEMNKLQEEHEKAIHKLEREEIAKAEERALHHANTVLKGEHDKKMNALQVERMLNEKQSKKRFEELEEQVWKKFETDRVNFENQKNIEISSLHNEVNGLTNQLLTKENQIATIEKQIHESEIIDKDLIERDQLINQLDAELSDLEESGKEARSNINNYQNKLHDLKKKLITKNHTVNKINDLHHQLDGLEQEISLHRERLSHHRVSQADYSILDTYNSQASSNNINRLLREVEEIKSVVKKRAVKKSSSVNRFAGRGGHDLHNRTINTSKVMNTEAEVPYIVDEDISRSILEENLDKEPTLEISKIIRKSHDPQKRHGPSGSTNRFLDDKRPKEQFISHSYSVSTHNYMDSFQKPKNEWKSVIEKERKTLEKYGQFLHQRKVEIRELQEQLKKEQEQYKIEYTSFKNATNKSSTKKLQLEIFKKSLNDKIYEYNRKLCQMRDKENILKSKKDALKKLEIGYKEYIASMNPNHSNLSELYQEYRKLTLDLQSEPSSQTKNVERGEVLAEKSHNISNEVYQGEGGRFNLNLVEILQRNKSIQEKNQTNRLDEGSKENYQARANGPEARTKINEKPPSAVFQRKFLRKPSPGPLTNLKSQLDQSKQRQESHSHHIKKEMK